MIYKIFFIILMLVQLIQCAEESSSKAVSSPVKRNVHDSNTTDFSLKHPYLQILRGRDGRDGLPGRDGVKGDKGDKGDCDAQGPPGPKCGGVVYTRWGRKSCPNNTGAQLLYEGIAGGSHYTHSGGGAIYICLPRVPDYLSTANIQYGDYLYGAEYQDVNNIFTSKHDHNVPCAVCYTSTKVVQLMMPAKTVCPTSWTVEYAGYLMADYYNHKRNAAYECVDKDPESINGSSSNNDGALFYFVKGTCTGLPCPPYVNNRVITCVVCTK